MGISERKQGRMCLHHHHNDVYACACGAKLTNYWGVVHHHKTCNKGPLELEYKTMDQTEKTVEHVNSDSQQIKADQKKIAEEKRKKKDKEKTEKQAKNKKEKIEKKGYRRKVEEGCSIRGE